jgi:regulator of cell morphogenesis and NO signaling
MRTAAEDYSVPEWACDSYRTLFRELERLEADVHRHVHLENHVLLPRAARRRTARDGA